MVAADLGRAVVLSTIPVAALLGVLRIGHLYVAAALIGVLTVVFDVASQSYLPSLVGREGLVEGNGKLAAGAAAAEFAGFGAGGWLVQWLTAPYAIAVDAATFLWSAASIARISTPEPPPVPVSERRPAVREIADGLRYVRGHPTLRALAASTAIFACAGRTYGTVFLLYVARDLGFAPGVLGLVLALGGLAAFAGALGAGRVIARLGTTAALVASFALIGAGNGLVALAGDASWLGLGWLVAQQVVKDPAWPVMDIARVSLRQTIAPERWQGRTHASLRVVEVGGLLLGTLLGGLLGGTIGLRATIAVAAAVGATAGLPLLVARVAPTGTTHAATVALPLPQGLEDERRR
jgi:MFS family permease